MLSALTSSQPARTMPDMELLLVYGNTFELMAPPPVGLAMLTKPLREAGHGVRVLDLMKVADPAQMLREALAEGRAGGAATNTSAAPKRT